MRTFSRTAAIALLLSSTAGHAKWFGDRDNRTPLTAAEYSTYSGIGKVRCIRTRLKRSQDRKLVLDSSTGIPVSEVLQFAATAFIVGSFDTVVTNSHSFVNEAWDAKTQRIVRSIVDPSTCNVIFIDQATGVEREIIPISYAKIRWQEAGLMGDKSNDIAIVKLSRRSTTPTWGLGYNTGQTPATINGASVELIGFHGDLNRLGKPILRKSGGHLYQPPPRFEGVLNAQRLNEPFKNLGKVVVGDYHAQTGASGSPIVFKGKVIAIHQGQSNRFDDAGNPDRQFDVQHNFNMAVLLDEKFHRELQILKSAP